MDTPAFIIHPTANVSKNANICRGLSIRMEPLMAMTIGWMLKNAIKIKRGEPIPHSRMMPENAPEIKGQYV